MVGRISLWWGGIDNWWGDSTAREFFSGGRNKQILGYMGEFPPIPLVEKNPGVGIGCQSISDHQWWDSTLVYLQLETLRELFSSSVISKHPLRLLLSFFTPVMECDLYVFNVKNSHSNTRAKSLF